MTSSHTDLWSFLELDRIIPQHLGVSEAVLDSVIFCHQDDSLWPMSQPLMLKKKFDEIFEASKWTKAVDNLKLLRKGHVSVLKEHRIWEVNLKANKDKGERVKKIAWELQAELDDLNVQLVAIDKELKVAMNFKVTKKEEAEQATGIVNNLNASMAQVEFFDGQIEHLKKTLVELKEPDNWLRTTLAQYEERMAQYQIEKDGYNNQYGQLNHDLTATRTELSEKQAERGQYQAQKEAYEDKLVARSHLVKEQARRLEIRGYNGDINESQVLDFTSRLRKLSQEKDRELERIKKETDDELRQSSASLKELDNLRTIATQERLTARQTITKNDKKLEALQREVDSINMDEGGKAVIVASLKDIQGRLRAAETQFADIGYDEALKSQKNELRDLGEEDDRLRIEQHQCNKLAAERASLEVVKSNLQKAKTNLDTLTSTYGERISALIGSDLRFDNLEREFQAVLDQRELTLADTKKQQTGTAADLSQTEYKLKTIRETLEKKKEQEKDYQLAVLKSILDEHGKPLNSIDDYEGELLSIETDRNEIKKEIDGYAYVNDFYDKCLSTVNKHNKCKLCERPFADKRERSSALDKINKKLAEDARSELEENLGSIEVDLQKAIAARPQFDSLKVLSQETDALEKDFKDEQRAKDGILQKLNRDDDAVNRQLSSTREAEALKSTVSSIARGSTSIAEMEAEVSRIASQQTHSSSSLSLDELNEKSEACKQRMQSLRLKYEKTVADKEIARSKLSNLENESSTANNKLSNAQHALDNKNAKLSLVREYRDSNDQQRDTIQRVDTELQGLEPRFKITNAKNDEVKQRGRSRERDLQVEKDRLTDTVNQFNLVESDINKYIDAGGPQRLAAAQRGIKVLDQKLQSIGEEITAVAQKGNEIKNLLDDSDRTKRNIEDNIHYRDMLRKQEELNIKIAELEESHVTDDLKRLAQEADNADKHYQKLAAKRGNLFGLISGKDNELLRLMTEYENEYQDAKEKYREAHIKVETTKAAIEDLGKYEHALDNAIMKYHSLKMDQINRIAGELWQNTYQGTDVDTIMIKSDNENASASATRRNYNYRVVMVKQDTEMDMRGRCSAGQKVLASIIIRLALAECFGANCGVCPQSPIR